MTQKANAIPPQKVKQSIAPTPIIHRLSQRGLAHEIGCGEGSIAKILDEQEVRLTQEQWFYLMTLGGKQLA